jgi:hypothetical protein
VGTIRLQFRSDGKWPREEARSVRTISARRSVAAAWNAAIIIAEAMVKAIITIAIANSPALRTISGETSRNLSGMCRTVAGCIEPGMNSILSFSSEWRCDLHHNPAMEFLLAVPLQAPNRHAR